ncbi:LysR family substrate-binding domain-containing protein [Microbacterium suaedae]|uniref:LysR family substrate-binding domain-containing protein n=1 Tax=Microbacterium suaedae TaxID=2067813 RepID=UPI000DA1DB7B|nr:LysR family substrate-binding domain-containing protein [Microbacterium suaedae]
MAQKKAPRGGRPRAGSTKGSAPRRGRPPQNQPAPREAPARLPVFRLGTIPGATPGKWIERWRTQRPYQRIELEQLDVATQLDALRDGLVDAAICRLPMADDDLHIVGLYDEIVVVVIAADSHLTVVEELEPGDLAGEVLITPRDDVLGPLDLPTEAPAFDPVATTEDAIATVASGVGIVVVPMSLARLHHRRDVTFRPLAGAPASRVVLAWLRRRDDEDVQALVGITRGRTARSSR